MEGPVRAGVRAWLALVVLTTALVTTGAAGAAAAPPGRERAVRPMGEGYETAVLDGVDRRRERRDLRGLASSACVDEVAESRARRMVVNDEMRHYDGLRKVFRRCGGSRVGEIVARGHGFRDPAAVVRAWMDSPPHEQVIVHPSYRQASVGAWRDEAGVVFVSVVFRAP